MRTETIRITFDFVKNWLKATLILYCVITLTLMAAVGVCSLNTSCPAPGVVSIVRGD